MFSSKFRPLLMGFIFFFFIPIPRAIAAERVVIRYHNYRMPIRVSELSEFSRTGQKSLSLQAYFRITGQDSQKMRSALSREVPVNPVTLSRTLNNPIGLVLLNPLGEVITTPSNRANRESLRGALVTSALNDNRISLIEVIENYPTEEVHVHGDRILETYQTMAKIINPIKFF
ncbi:alpha/beta hydrolase [Cyanobacterium sp. IPPAS B-1200]|uniref:alpha/beta hydrolase n=1 Tax=Cyanobacterium sp. IPPAS B-1200 TaxID=1562720 RepID=UPI000B17BBD8|nr:alpha/beta hydrolase [Cyanobacterium sp. IPPAS B-1200]